MSVDNTYSLLERQVRGCINDFITKDVQYAACLAGPIVSMANSDCFNSSRFYGGNSFVFPDPGVCRTFANQFNCCPANINDKSMETCRDLFQKVFINSIPLVPFFSISTWIMFSVFIAMALFLAVTFYLSWRNWSTPRQICALLKKNWQVWQFFWIRNLAGYALPLILIAILHIVIAKFTERNEMKQINVDIPFDFKYYTKTETMRITIDVVSESKINMYQNLRSVIGLFFLVVFIYPISNTISDLVIEKQSRMKETLKLSGVSVLTIVFTDFLTKAIVFTPLALSCAIFTKYGLIFPSQDLGYLFFFFILYLMSMTSFCYGITVFFNQSRPAIICGVTSVLALFMQVYRVLSMSLYDQKVSTLSAPVGLGIGLQTMVHEASFGQGIAIAYDRYNREVSVSNQIVELNFITRKFP